MSYKVDYLNEIQKKLLRKKNLKYDIFLTLFQKKESN